MLKLFCLISPTKWPVRDSNKAKTKSCTFSLSLINCTYFVGLRSLCYIGGETMHDLFHTVFFSSEALSNYLHLSGQEIFGSITYMFFYCRDFTQKNWKKSNQTKKSTLVDFV